MIFQNAGLIVLTIKEIERNINKYRPECHLIYCSDTTIYKSNEKNKEDSLLGESFD